MKEASNLDVGEVDVERQLLSVLVDVLLDGTGVGVAAVSRVVDPSRDVDPFDAIDLRKDRNDSGISSHWRTRFEKDVRTLGTANDSRTSFGISRSLNVCASLSSSAFFKRPASPSSTRCASSRTFSSDSILVASAADGLPTTVMEGAETKYLCKKLIQCRWKSMT